MTLTHLDLESSHELLVSGSSLSEKLSPVAGGWDNSTRHISESKSLLEKLPKFQNIDKIEK